MRHEYLSSIALIVMLGGAAPSCAGKPSTPDQASTGVASKRMADGKEWTTNNLNLAADHSYCHGDAEQNCQRYGRLYSWDSAQRICPTLGDGWRLPTDAEWRQMAKHYGGVVDDSNDEGRAAYRALMAGGNSGFDALLGGNRSANGQYERLEAHGLFWTASETAPATAWMYNFGRGSLMLNRHAGGVKDMAISVRCVRD